MSSLPVPVAPAALSNSLSPDFSADLSHIAADLAREGKSSATRRAYASDWRVFAQFCAIAGADPLPARPETVAAFIASRVRDGAKFSTIRRSIAAISYAHRLAGADAPAKAGPVQAVLAGARRRIGVAVDAKAPATARSLTGMLKRIPDTIRGKRDRALLLLGFAAALRRSELVALNVEDLERQAEGLVVHIRRSKTDQAGAGHSVAVPRGGKLKPVQAVEEWLDAAGITEGAVFRSVGKGGAVGGRLSAQAVADVVKDRAAAAGLEPSRFSGHSLRAGFVTSALEAGADVLKVMDVTRHKSVETLKGYDRRAKLFQNHAGRGFL